MQLLDPHLDPPVAVVVDAARAADLDVLRLQPPHLGVEIGAEAQRDVAGAAVLVQLGGAPLHVSTSRRRPPTAAVHGIVGGVAPADQHAAVVRRDLDLGAAIQAEAVAQRLGDGDAALAGDAHGVSPPADGWGVEDHTTARSAASTSRGTYSYPIRSRSSRAESSAAVEFVDPPRSSIPWCSARRAEVEVRQFGDVQAGPKLSVRQGRSECQPQSDWAVLTLRDPYVVRGFRSFIAVATRYT